MIEQTYSSITLKVPVSKAGELSDYKIEDELSGTLLYDVVSKSTTGVELKVKQVIIEPKKRID